jgi:FlaA1/EpsC-like NDP-sugar epimerase
MSFTSLFLEGNKKKGYIFDHYKNPRQFIFKQELLSIMALSLKIDTLKIVLTLLGTNYKGRPKKLVVFIVFLVAAFIIYLVRLIYSYSNIFIF